MAGPADPAWRAAEAAARDSYGRLLAFLAARSRDVAAAEDALAEAFAAALASWPRDGVPRSPEAWLLVAARRRLADAARRRQTRLAAADRIVLAAEEAQARADEPAGLPDERLGLLFACAHPAIDPAVHAPLMLQVVLGVEAAPIAAACLVAPAAMAQRLVRAKRKILEAGIPFRVPDAGELPDRVGTVLDAVYAAYTLGRDEVGERPAELTREALWLARLTARLLPAEPEAQGLAALLLHVEARRPAGRDDTGRFVPLAEQDPAAWDSALIGEAEALLRHAAAAGRIGRFQLEAAIQSAHAVRRRGGPADWAAILALYDRLLELTGSVVVAINRCVALAEVDGAAAGLAALDALAGDPRLAAYQPWWAARAGLLDRAGDRTAAVAAYDRAMALAIDPAVRGWLGTRRDAAARPA
ncbi:MAG: DUF6596 domain-containing protein [Geminicoccaceae bacterium]